MIEAIVAFLTSAPVLAILGTIGLAILDALAATLTNSHPLIARALIALANLLRSQSAKVPPPRLPMLLLAMLVLPLFAGVVSAETITTTDGCKYTKAKDGCYYPSAYVRADGSVSSTPLATATARTRNCDCGDGCNCTMPGGKQYYVCPWKLGFDWPGCKHPSYSACGCSSSPACACLSGYPYCYCAKSGNCDCRGCAGKYITPNMKNPASPAPKIQTLWQSGPGTLGTKPQTWVIPAGTIPPSMFGGCPSCSGGSCPGGVCPVPSYQFAPSACPSCSGGSCPGGVCPAPQSRPAWRLFRR